jgi:inosine-uridine nucleoside N-ribohydrolase/formylmethanofuran dehydrogenase subunit E
MKKPALFFLLICLPIIASTQPPPAKVKHTVIIDTDGAIDDMRAISYLLSRPEITITAILLSDGSLPPAEGARKVRSLLHEFKRDSIRLAEGNELAGVDPPWREFNRKIVWGEEDFAREPDLNSVICLSEELKKTNEKIILVCLGPLTNIAELIKKDAALLTKVERVTWYNDALNPMNGFNYACDTVSSNLVFASGIRIDVISNLHKEQAFFDSSLVAISKESNTQLSDVINHVFIQPPVAEKLKLNHFRLNDDLVALFITNPELFNINTQKNNFKIRYNQDYNVQAVREAISDMISGNYVSEKNVVFNRFPFKPEMFNYDIRPIIDTAIIRYGFEEWKANVMTDEFHGHLGVFSIVGAKMGIKAREIFGVGPDVLRVVTDAGIRPPYSCLNDGIQVSTGSTLGMGLISLSNDTVARPSAVFTYQNRSVRLTLKQEYLGMVNRDIQEGIVKYGLSDDGYWKLVRRNAIKYWLEWDRNVIFEIEEWSVPIPTSKFIKAILPE